jgi:hypothetical protein
MSAKFSASVNRKPCQSTTEDIAMLATVLLFSAALTPIPMPGYIDRIVEHRADGDVILRTSEHSDFSGGKVRLEQKLRRLSGHRFFIDLSDQPAATKIYH